MNRIWIKCILLLPLILIASCSSESHKPMNSIGFVVTEQCLPSFDKTVKVYEIDRKITFEQFPVNNLEGGYYVASKRYVLLSSDNYSRSELIATMNGILEKCGLDSTISIDLKVENADQQVKALMDRLVQNPELQKGITFSIKDSILNMHQNSEAAKF